MSLPHAIHKTPDTGINWKQIIDQAWKHRAELIDNSDTDSWRILHGYSEGAPGTVVEKFNRHAIVEYKNDIRSDLKAINDALLDHFPFESIIAKGHQSLGLKLRQRVFFTHGILSDSPVFANEYGIKYSVMPGAVHNCGLYLDARPVRKWLAANSQSRRVLNLFAFTGSLGAASMGGHAAEVVHLDKSAELLPRIQATYHANHYAFDTRSFLRGDIYKHLPRAIKRGQRFDGIILDPPPKVYASPFAKNKPQGQDFAQLVHLCSQLLNDGGWLLAMFHRFDSTWAQEEARVIEASDNTLTPRERFTSDDDFPEEAIDKKLRVSVFDKG